MVRKIPRGKGYDKAATVRHYKKMRDSGIPVDSYVKQAGLKLDTFLNACCHHLQCLPEDLVRLWFSWCASRVIQQNCEQCQETYWPSKKGTRFCSPYCGNMFRKDQEYFGGKRNSTAGLAEGVCQLCQRQVDRGLSSHHIYGKANDSDNEFLLALCSGCHAIVSDLALKRWVIDPVALERLIWLAINQRQGAHMIRERKDDGLGVRIEVKVHSASYLPS